MSAVDMRTRRVVFHGRVADELTRQDLTPRQFGATLAGHRRRPVVKEDGSFAFVDLPVLSYDIDLAGPQYQPRRVTVAAPVTGTTPIVFAGEDELHVIVTRSTASGRIDFARHDFLPPIADAAAVLGEGGAASTLDEPLEGLNVTGAQLTSAVAFTPGMALRIVRSARLMMRPGPYYPFPDGTTLVACRVMDSSSAAPVVDAQLRITDVNGAPLATSTVAGLTLYRASLPAVPPPPLPQPPVPFMLGTDAARTTRANARGDAVLYYPPDTPVTQLTIEVSHAAYVTQSVTLPVNRQQRTSQIVQLIRI